MGIKTILIIDDDAALRDIYSTALARGGYDTLAAADGQDGLDLAKNRCPDLILLDVMMPDKDGLEVLEELKSDLNTRDIPVVMLTNIVQEEEHRRCREMGVTKYLVKTGVDPNDLVREAQDIVGPAA
ncbi:hypothetical protein AMJ57_01515 [Parcubacteria bacterium SG8_24]|nr:MAG: hypothetical protein AMJ57_01515 [Parcubacteria bacterium SG8_24]